MPKRKDIKKVMVIGSGPIVIGQAAEFDYAGTQACLALKEEGYEVILVNSNPATIMTDTHIADKVYMEPLTLEYVAKIIRYERPDAIVPGLGGQTGLNLAVQLAKKGILRECQVEILGTSFESIEQAEDRELFKELCESLGEPVLPSEVANSVEEAVEIAAKIGYPVVLRPAFTLGGTGGGFADDEQELRELMRHALSLSPVHQVLVEKSIKGYKEIEYEVMRDRNDTAISICCMENIDPVGIHTGDSIVVAPSQTLTNKEFQMLRDSALKIIRALKIEGGCNVQFALDPLSFKYYLIEVNPRVSRSSALASKASGYPIARVSAKIAVGLTLDEIRIANTPASFEPTLDYVVTKVARFPFDKFADASNKLGTQMKATGEVMSIGRTMEESLLKAVRSLETGVCHIYHKKFDSWSNDDLLAYIKEGTDDRLYAIAQLIRGGVDLALIYNNTKIDMFFLEKFKNIVEFEHVVRAHPMDPETLRDAKRMGFSDKFIGQLWGLSQHDVYRLREKNNIFPVYKMIDTCASEFDSYVPYFYSTYEQENESKVSDKEKIVVLGSGPIRIGQGVEFDYSTVHAIWSIREAGYEAIIINNNPETVSTDYTTSDKLYFEPLTVEDVMNVIHLEKPKGIVVSLGGQTAINLAEPLAELQRLATAVGGNAADLGTFASHYIEKLSSAYNMGFAVACISLIISYIIYVAFRKTFKHADVTAKQQAASGAAAQVELTPAQTKSRITALMLVFAVVIFFWMAFHQNGSTMTFFARDYTTPEATGFTRMFFDIFNLLLVLVGVYGLVGMFQAEKGRGKLIGGIAVIAAVVALYYRYTVTPDPVHILPQVFQQFNPFYVVALTPLSVALFASLARKGKEPSAPRKIGMGMIIAALGFLILTIGSFGLMSPAEVKAAGASDTFVSQNWLISTYLVLTFAELLLSPMGISFVSKVAPPKYKGMMMGCWFAATAVGNYATSLIGYLWGSGMALWMVWSVLIVLCLLSALFIFSIMKKLENATA